MKTYREVVLANYKIAEEEANKLFMQNILDVIKQYKKDCLSNAVKKGILAKKKLARKKLIRIEDGR